MGKFVKGLGVGLVMWYWYVSVEVAEGQMAEQLFSFEVFSIWPKPIDCFMFGGRM